jgi:serine/threonine protein kinase
MNIIPSTDIQYLYFKTEENWIEYNLKKRVVDVMKNHMQHPNRCPVCCLSEKPEFELENKVHLGNGMFVDYFTNTQMVYRLVAGDHSENAVWDELIDLIHLEPHEHILPIESIHRDKEVICFCQQRWGTPLSKWERTFHLEEKKQILNQIANGLSFLHDHNITFKTFSKKSILISVISDTLHVKLTDFGLGRNRLTNSLSGEDFATLMQGPHEHTKETDLQEFARFCELFLKE